MTVRLFELAGADPDLRFSPYCWRVRMALAHKGLEVETVPWRFAERDALPEDGGGAVPVLVDGGRVVGDSWRIALYLDEAYPDRPALFGSDEAWALGLFVKHWCETTVHPAVMKIILTDVVKTLRPEDAAYFREHRERRFGMSLEAFAGEPEAARRGLDPALRPLRATLGDQAFLGGPAADFADYTVFGAFMWARVVRAEPLLADDDPLNLWQTRMLALFDGLAGRAPSAMTQRENAA